jgi:hypothetical protein
MMAATGFTVFATNAPGTRYHCSSLPPATLIGSLTMMAVTGFTLLATKVLILPTTVQPFH